MRVQRENQHLQSTLHGTLCCNQATLNSFIVVREKYYRMLVSDEELSYCDDYDY